MKEPKTEKSMRRIDLSLEAKKYLSVGEPDSFVLGGEKPLSYTQYEECVTAYRSKQGSQRA